MLGETVEGAGSSSAGPLIECSHFLSRVGTLSTTTAIHLSYESGGSLCLILHKFSPLLSDANIRGLGNVKIMHASTFVRAKGKAKFVGTFFFMQRL